jgi:streptogramin lyase
VTQSTRHKISSKPRRVAARAVRRSTREATRGRGLQSLRIIVLSIVFALGTLGAVFALEGPTGAERARRDAVTAHQHVHAAATERTVLGPLLASSDNLTVRLDARIADADLVSDRAIPTGRKVILSFVLRDPATGTPLTGLSPAARLQPDIAAPINPYGPPDTGDPFDARETFVLVNDTGDLGVLESDGAGAHRHAPGASLTRLTGSNFSSVVKLPDASADALTDLAGRYVFASIPSQNLVAIVDTLTLRVAHLVPVGAEPTSLALEPSGNRVWVGNDGDGTVSAIDIRSHSSDTYRVGDGHHEFAFSNDSRLAFVSNSESKTVGAISSQDGRVVAELPIAGGPGSMDFAAGRLFVAQPAVGSVAVFDVQADQLIAAGAVRTGAGSERVRVHPFSQIGVATNRQANTATLFDTSTLQVIKQVRTGLGPDDIAFVEDYVVIRNSLSPDVTFVNVTNPDVADEVAIGSEPYLDEPHPGVHARLFVNSAGDEVLVPNPAEGQVYQLHVMMGRPMVMDQIKVDRGSETVLSPAAVVRELDPGTYSRIVRFAVAGGHTLSIDPGDGRTPVAFRLEAVSPNALRPWEVTAVQPGSPYVSGQTSLVSFQVVERATNRPEDRLQEPMISVYQFAPGQTPWQQVLPANYAGQGRYQAAVVFPRSGAYSATLSALATGLSASDVPASTFEVGDR